MKMNLQSFSTFLLLICGLSVLSGCQRAHEPYEAKKAGPADKQSSLGASEGDTDRAIERTRKQVRMLDSIYKGSIVLITKEYVHDDGDLAAGTAFKQIFDIAKQGDFHECRLVDATGEPIEDENAPNTPFEETAIAKLKAGETWYEVESTEDGKRILHVATAIPVVMDKCVDCHSNYADFRNGEAIGALSYTIAIE